jgi:hypothetical protein
MKSSSAGERPNISVQRRPITSAGSRSTSRASAVLQ